MKFSFAFSGIKRLVSRLAFVMAFTQMLFAVALAQNLEIDFLDVGQGDAVLIRSPDGKVALYDAGRKNDDVADQLKALGVKTLDLLVMSHADADHIGGAAEVALRFKPRAFLSNGIPAATQTYQRTLDALGQVGAQGLQASERTISLGNQVRLQVLPPERRNTDQNENSVGILVQFGGFRTLLTGDSEPATQRYWLGKYAPLVASLDVYKSSHHGAKNNDTQAWLEVLKPQDVVISAGINNQYGHPANETIALYRSVGAQVWRTDLEARVSLSVASDGRYRIKSRAREFSRNSQGMGQALNLATTVTTSTTTQPSPATSQPSLLGTVQAFGGTLYLYDGALPAVPVGVTAPRLLQVIPIGGIQVHFYDAPNPSLSSAPLDAVQLVSSQTRASVGTRVVFQMRFEAGIDTTKIAKVVYRVGNGVAVESSLRPSFPATWTVTAGAQFGVSSVGESNLTLSAVLMLTDSSYALISQVQGAIVPPMPPAANPPLVPPASEPSPPVTTPVPSGSPPRVAPNGGPCCKICTTGKACGNSCIAKNKNCKQPPGCACDSASSPSNPAAMFSLCRFTQGLENRAQRNGWYALRQDMPQPRLE